MDLISAIPILRESTVAIFKYREVVPAKKENGKFKPAEYKCGWGSGVCIVKDKYLLTAFHILNGGKPRNPKDKFIAFIVPNNGKRAYRFPIIDFPIEKPDIDIAILEIGAPNVSRISLPSVPITLNAPSDGVEILTIGFPAPEINSINIDPQGNYVSGNFFLKSHANEGILSAKYTLGNVEVFEFNIGWHHGESGGPVTILSDPVKILTVMQQYRNVKSPHGIMAGPHRGCSLVSIKNELKSLGAKII